MSGCCWGCSKAISQEAKAANYDRVQQAEEIARLRDRVLELKEVEAHATRLHYALQAQLSEAQQRVRELEASLKIAEGDLYSGPTR